VRRLLIDADTGVDDALALIMAFNSPGVDVLGVSTVAGNSNIDNCTRNTLFVADAFARTGFGVARGAAKGLTREPFTAEEVHGPTGMGTIIADFDVSSERLSQLEASEFILSSLSEYEDVEILATGPLTNIALALSSGEQTFRRAKRIVSMGGALDVPGNTGPFAEFNYFVDPEAANLVLGAGLDLTVVSLDVSTRAFLPRERLCAGSALSHADSKISAPSSSRKPLAGRAEHIDSAATIIDACNFYFDYHERIEGIDGGFMHDPLALAVLLDESIAELAEFPVRVELGSRRRGMTVRSNDTGRPAVKVVKDINLENFWRRFDETVIRILCNA
jgi:inosine-uridine nucleoside N-ribohydrolase